MGAHDRVVIVGGGIAGVATASALRSGGYGGGIVLIERAEFPYDRPPLSKDYLAGLRDLKQIALQPPEWYAEQRIDLMGPAEVASISPGDDDVAITLNDGRAHRADWAVLATGGRAALPPVPGLGEARQAGLVHVLREAEDADRLRAALARPASLLVVGGGLIGAEAASTAVSLGAEVVVADPLDPPLVAAAGREVAAWLHALHAQAGIETVTSALEAVRVDGGGVLAQLCGEPQVRRFDAVLVGVGMVPSTEVASACGLEVDRGVLVDAQQRTSHPRVLAVGDAARLREHDRTEHWEAAQHDGQRAAATILDTPPPAETAAWWWSDRHQHHVEGVGTMREPDAQTTVVNRGTRGTEPFSAYTIRAGRLLGAVAVDDPHAIRAARRLIDRQIEVDPDRIADPATDLRKLLRG
jgi:3-phenylpropionate/trans-cinnamate dioxygenase ferredoxin reductase subunit